MQLCLYYVQSYQRCRSYLFFGLNHSFSVAVNQLQLPPQRHCVCFITATSCLFNDDSLVVSHTSHYYRTLPRLTPVNLINLLTTNDSMNDSVTVIIISRSVYSFIETLLSHRDSIILLLSLLLMLAPWRMFSHSFCSIFTACRCLQCAIVSCANVWVLFVFPSIRPDAFSDNVYLMCTSWWQYLQLRFIIHLF